MLPRVTDAAARAERTRDTPGRSAGRLAPHGLEKGAAQLARREQRFRDVVERLGLPRFVLRPPGFATLLHIILEQQVSIDAAAAMFRRLHAECDPLTPQSFLRVDDERLRRCGFSRQKAAYGRALATAVIDGSFDVNGLAERGDDEVFAALTSLKGIGSWTAEVYMLFALGRPDVWPAGDLGLQLGIEEVFSLSERPRPQVLRAMAEPWRPWRSVAACLVWHSYLSTRGRKPPLLPHVTTAV
jgi:DNA-3-methyladenine glycosylase II